MTGRSLGDEAENQSRYECTPESQQIARPIREFLQPIHVNLLILPILGLIIWFFAGPKGS